MGCSFAAGSQRGRRREGCKSPQIAGNGGFAVADEGSARGWLIHTKVGCAMPGAGTPTLVQQSAGTELGEFSSAIPMRAIVVMDEAAGTAGMTLVERPAPPAAINDVIVQIHASGFVPTEME